LEADTLKTDRRYVNGKSPEMPTIHAFQDFFVGRDDRITFSRYRVFGDPKRGRPHTICKALTGVPFRTSSIPLKRLLLKMIR
jgi:hypothetical protein